MVQGLLLAAGAGRRMGTPKALVRDEAGDPWLVRSVRALREGGCDAVTVVLGAAFDEASALVADEAVAVVRAEQWAEGMGASLRAGLAALEPAASALVHLVDLPDVGSVVITRVAAADTGPESLARASYDGTPGHPVLLGSDHWQPIIATASGDRGARGYLAAHPPVLVECGDLASGHDVDRPTGSQRPPA